MAGTISLSGLVSGYDTQSIISALVSVASANLRNMQADLTQHKTRLSLYQSFNTLVDSLRSAGQDIDSINELTALTAVSSDESILTAEISGDSFPGSYAISVNNLAVAETSTSQAIADRDASVGTGTITITVGTGDPQEIDISGESLDEVAEKINDEATGVTAYVVDTGNPTNPYKLMITADDTGEDNAFTISGGATSLTFTETVAAEDSEIEVNGETITNASNTITDIVPGVTLTLLSESASEVALTINRDMEGIKSNITDFVESYNEVMAFINDQFDYSEDTGAGVLSGDSTLRYIQRSIQQVITTSFDDDSAAGSLGLIGVSTNADGSLSVDDDALLEALADNYTEVMDLFTGEDGLLETLDGKLDVFLDSSDGTLKTKTDSIEEMISTVEDKILREQDRIDQVEERLIRQFSNMEAILNQFKSTQAYLTALEDVQNKKK